MSYKLFFCWFHRVTHVRFKNFHGIILIHSISDRKMIFIIFIWMETANYVWILRDTSRREYYILLTVAKSQIFRVLSSEAETSSFESDDHDTSEIPCKKKSEQTKVKSNKYNIPNSCYSYRIASDKEQQIVFLWSGSGLSITRIIIFLPVCVQIRFSQIFHHKLPIFLCSCQQLNEKKILKYLFFFLLLRQWLQCTMKINNYIRLFFIIDKKGPASKQLKNFTFCNRLWVKEIKTLLVTPVPWKNNCTY